MGNPLLLMSETTDEVSDKNSHKYYKTPEMSSTSNGKECLRPLLGR